MRRGNRQKQRGAERDWCLKRLRRLFGLNQRPGRGKYSKRAMARRRRRELRLYAEEEGEEALTWRAWRLLLLSFGLLSFFAELHNEYRNKDRHSHHSVNGGSLAEEPEERRDEPEHQPEYDKRHHAANRYGHCIKGKLASIQTANTMGL